MDHSHKPTFLIIGAMKAGTTTLVRDLERVSPRVFFPLDKEPGHLAEDAVLTEDGRAGYLANYKRMHREQVGGDASTIYTKQPRFQGVARRALDVLGSELRVIYIVREPVARLCSHHYHASNGRMPADIDRAVWDHPELINYSRYAMQLEPWLETFGPDQVKVVRFEDYIADRAAGASDLARFIGVEPNPAGIDEQRIYNRGQAKPHAGGPAWQLSRTWPYRRLIRPVLGRSIKDRLRHWLMPSNPPPPPPPRLDTVRHIIDQVNGDVDHLQNLLGHDKPMWDMQQVYQQHLTRSQAARDSG